MSKRSAGDDDARAKKVKAEEEKAPVAWQAEYSLYGLETRAFENLESLDFREIEMTRRFGKVSWTISVKNKKKFAVDWVPGSKTGTLVVFGTIEGIKRLPLELITGGPQMILDTAYWNFHVADDGYSMVRIRGPLIKA